MNIAERLKSNETLVKLNIPKKRYIWAMLQFPLFNSGLHQLGWFKSARLERAIDKKGNPIPWMTYGIIFFLQDRLSKDMTVFEWGSGNSTKFWAERVKEVTAVEYDSDWTAIVQPMLPDNASLIEASLGNEYTDAIKKSKKKYSVIVIDGRMRVECSEVAPAHLAKGGVIIWDNTNRERYQNGIAALKEQGFKMLTFKGLAPQSNMVTETSLFYKDENVLGL